MLYATIFLCVFVVLGGVVYYLSKTIDAGEARFDTRNDGEDEQD